MSGPIYFNFKTVMDRLGIPLTNKNNWIIGRALQQFASSQGLQPEHILTKKTNPSPSVSAPHCIAHYPIALLPMAITHIDAIWKNSPNNTTTQLQLFPEPTEL